MGSNFPMTRTFKLCTQFKCDILICSISTICNCTLRMKPNRSLNIRVDNNGSHLSQASYDLGPLQVLFLKHLRLTRRSCSHLQMKNARQNCWLNKGHQALAWEATRRQGCLTTKRWPSLQGWLTSDSVTRERRCHVWARGSLMLRNVGKAFPSPSATGTSLPQCCHNIVNRPGKTGTFSGKRIGRITQNTWEKTN